jgi:hypothetical protein
MPPSEIVLGTLGSLMAAGSLITPPKLWGGYLVRREVRFRGRMYSGGDIAFMFWGGPAFPRGLMRCFLPMTLAWGGAMIGICVAALNGGAAGQQAPHAAKVAAVVTVAWFGVWFALAVTIILLNWPKLMVPPGQRGEPGAVAEWRAGKAQKRNRR